MSDGTNFYNRLIAYNLWITRAGASEPELVTIQRSDKLHLPLSGKVYKLTLRNLKLYLKELKQADPTIIEICIDRISRVGIMRWSN